MKTLAKVLAVVVTLFACYHVLAYGLKKQEIVDCYRLQSQSEEFADAGFYIAAWQNEMCDGYGVSINAPIR